MKSKHEQMYMRMAKAIAETSSSTRLKVGTIMVKNGNVISTGYNAMPAHLQGPLEDDEGNTKPEVRHSEKNALMGLIRSSESSIGSYMFTTHSCCYFCSIDIIDAGILRFYYLHEYRCSKGLQNLRDNGVEVIKLERLED